MTDHWTRTCVLVPTDFSEASMAALDEARAIVGGDLTRLHVVHVAPVLHPMDPGLVWNAAGEAQRIADIETYLSKQLDERGFTGATPHAGIGDAGSKITRVAKQIGADLIVVSSHGRTGLAHLLLGSVAERVTRLAPCPVLIIRNPPA